MENGTISDKQVTASSQYKERYAAFYGRLHAQEGDEVAGAWSALTNDVNQWLQVDLIYQYTNITRVATQGRHSSYSQWVTKYQLQYSNDGVHFQNYTGQGQNAATKVTCTIIL